MNGLIARVEFTSPPATDWIIDKLQEFCQNKVRSVYGRDVFITEFHHAWLWHDFLLSILLYH
jgi:hypothetical protein